MGLAFWRNYHEQQSKAQSPPPSPLKALESPTPPSPPKPEQAPVKAEPVASTEASSPPPPKTEAPVATKASGERERLLQKVQGRSRTQVRQSAKGA